MHGLAMLAAYKWGLFIVLFVDEAGNSVPKDFRTILFLAIFEKSIKMACKLIVRTL